MSTLQISASMAASTPSAAASRPSRSVLRFLGAVVSAIGETNRRRAEREIARAARTYGLDIAGRA